MFCRSLPYCFQFPALLPEHELRYSISILGFSFSGSTSLVLERPSPAAGWIFCFLVVQFQYWNGRVRRPAGFSFSNSTTLVLERPAGCVIVSGRDLLSVRSGFAA